MNAQIFCDAVARSTRPQPRLRYWRAIVAMAIGVAVGAIGAVAVLRHLLSVPAEMLPVVAEIDVYQYSSTRGPFRSSQRRTGSRCRLSPRATL